MRAALLAVGTELTTGQITNTNAAYLSKILTECGAEVDWHFTVPDDREKILKALRSCEEVADLIFVTGGLGPTTDDFTRDVIADWAGLKLFLSDESWESLKARILARGRQPIPSQKQQCYFPENAQRLSNSKGTAEGFFLNVRGKKTWVLPGPPFEVEAVWNEGVAEQIRVLIPNGPRDILMTWVCKGKAEAEIGELVERIVAGTALRTGYRCFRPFVEVKIWCARERVGEHQKYFDQIKSELSEWLTEDHKFVK